jgi:hypothetical protein
MEPRYKIMRFYFKGGARILHRGLTLAQAQKHCSDPETSSRTAVLPLAKARTEKFGAWFEGYEVDA